MHSGQLDTARLTDNLPLEVFAYWEDNGYPINGIEEAHVVVSPKENADNDGYLVCKVDTLERPLKAADVVEDQTTMWACSCPAFQYHCNVDLESKRLPEWGSCKHCQKVSKVERAKTDEKQRELGE